VDQKIRNLPLPKEGRSGDFRKIFLYLKLSDGTVQTKMVVVAFGHHVLFQNMLQMWRHLDIAWFFGKTAKTDY
jgi:hypothetical protein